MISTHTYEDRIAAIHRELGVPEYYAKDTGMPLYPEAAELVSVGADIYGRVSRLTPLAARSWQVLRRAAERDGISLLLVSAFRSVDEQRLIIEKKLLSGEPMDQIFRTNAAPGHSEHHTGRAIHLTTPGCEPVTEEFDRTLAFAWLITHAGDFQMGMTYSHENKYGMLYEPWHWSLL